jgi:hypothetical protein
LADDKLNAATNVAGKKKFSNFSFKNVFFGGGGKKTA